tara:strand:+ start:18566 stop:18811 length:246 start_codon:yes stop_codon:yes gene_type:complete
MPAPREFLCFLLLWGTPGLAVLLILKISALPKSIEIIIVFCLFLLWFFLLFRKGGHLDKENQEARKQKEKAALQRWDSDSA